MYDVIYFSVWSDIICTAAKLLHGTSAFSQKSLYRCFAFLQAFFRQVRILFWFYGNSICLLKDTRGTRFVL